MLEIIGVITGIIGTLSTLAIQPLSLMVLITMILGKLTAKKEIKEIICYSYYILVIALFANRIIPASILLGIIIIIIITGYLIVLCLETDSKTKIKCVSSIIILCMIYIMSSKMGKSYEIIMYSLLILNVILLLILPLYHLYINNIKSKLIYFNVITSGASLSFLLVDDDLRNEKFLIYLVIVTIVTKIFRKISDNVKIGMYLVPYIIYLILKISKLNIRELYIDYIILLTPLILIIIGIRKEKKATVKELDIITMIYFIFYSFWELLYSLIA